VNDKLPLHQNTEITNFNKTFGLRQTKTQNNNSNAQATLKLKTENRTITAGPNVKLRGSPASGRVPLECRVGQLGS
jgi:hypothetical protein